MTKEMVRKVQRLTCEFNALADKAIVEDVEKGGHRSYVGYTKTSAALRRKSMDLTRALAEMRRS